MASSKDIIKTYTIRDVNLDWLEATRSPRTDQEVFFLEWFLENLPQIPIFYERLILRSDKESITPTHKGKQAKPAEKRPDYIVPRYIEDDIPFFPDEHDMRDFPVLGIEFTFYERENRYGQELKQPMRELAALIGMPLAIIFHGEEYDFMNMFYSFKAHEQEMQGNHNKYKDLDLWAILAETVEYWVTEYEPSKRTDSAA